MHLHQSAALSVQAEGNMHIISIATEVVLHVYEVGTFLALKAGSSL